MFLLTVAVGKAQDKSIDKLRLTLKTAKVDTVRLQALIELSKAYFISNPDSCIIFAQQAYELAERFNRLLDEGRALNNLANAYATMGDYAKGMQFYLKARRTYVNISFVPGIVMEDNNIGATYVQKADYKNALPYLQRSDKQWTTYTLNHKLKNSSERQQMAVVNINIGECYLYTHKMDSALRYLAASYADAKKYNITTISDNIERDLGEVEIEYGHKELALKHLKSAVALSKAADDPEMLSISYLSTAKLFHKFKQQDSAEYYSGKALETAKAGNYQQDVLNAGTMLYNYYDEDHNLPQAYKYYKLTTAAKDSIFSQDKVKQLLSLDFEEKQRQQDIAAAQMQYRDQVRMYGLLAGLAILLLMVFIFWRNSRHRKFANLLLLKQKQEIEITLEQLQFTQSQLIQSEKMASLGELTAGIAHEIQNPLNFVNNFSEVNIELINEMEAEMANGDQAEVAAILEDIKQNLEKISHHGKRADGIVKGMLQHSRASSNTKEPTDINKLTDEYLRLAYHGLRAKDKTFNSELIVNFSENLPLVNIVPQDIGRVVLNLFTNAFYAVHQKQKAADKAYQPAVTLSTGLDKAHVIIKVKDNGNGIRANIRDKIMQPFFTTKPTGEGTGLGLSMSYEIIKAHEGTIEVESVEGEYTEFIVKLPI